MDLAVIVLNWNGWQDTLECISSLFESTHPSFRIILVDNDSEDESLGKIRIWSKGKIPITVGPHKNVPKIYNVELYEMNQHEIINPQATALQPKTNGKDELVLIKNDSNLGFAGGNNVGIRYAMKCGFNKILLLNNDTTIDPECLCILSEFLDMNECYDVVTPKINHYDHPDKIWNCGGKLTIFGSRKYYYDNKKEHDFKNGIKDINFITGCALMSRAIIYERYGLLSERFFFGEEDFEFSLRMNKYKVMMAAVLSAKLYHKIGIAKDIIFNKDRLAKAFIHHLNRFINLKNYYPKFYWKIWRVISLCYMVSILRVKYNTPFSQLVLYYNLLYKFSDNHVFVTKDDLDYVKTVFQ